MPEIWKASPITFASQVLREAGVLSCDNVRFKFNNGPPRDAVLVPVVKEGQKWMFLGSGGAIPFVKPRDVVVTQGNVEVTGPGTARVDFPLPEPPSTRLILFMHNQLKEVAGMYSYRIALEVVAERTPLDLPGATTTPRGGDVLVTPRRVVFDWNDTTEEGVTWPTEPMSEPGRLLLHDQIRKAGDSAVWRLPPAVWHSLVPLSGQGACVAPEASDKLLLLIKEPLRTDRLSILYDLPSRIAKEPELESVREAVAHCLNGGASQSALNDSVVLERG